MYDLVIVGSGPAGLSAAVYAKRAGFNTLVLEKNAMSGGQVLTTYEVDNYLGLPGINGFDLGMKFREHAENMGVEFLEAEAAAVKRADENQTDAKTEPEESSAEAGGKNPGELVACEHREDRVFSVVTDKGEYKTRAVLAATGAVHAKLGVPGEEELAGRGVSYCATCDGAFFRNRTVAVVGGGDVAAEDAVFLARTCRKVYLIHRRDELRAAEILQKKVKGLPNVEILWNTVVEEISGKEQVEKIKIRNVISGKEEEKKLDGIFIAVGIRPDTEVFKALVKCDEKGYIEAGEDGATTVPGIFAAGDVRTKLLRQIVTAVADGANAVAGIQNYFLQ
ncbi:MAG TPA: thioredoxin-disulfide reductase [Lachnospiraceae bacterium]|nr:thioredoxin-disulfide reductase [Lachnospiraceae bacterium]